MHHHPAARRQRRQRPAGCPLRPLRARHRAGVAAPVPTPVGHRPRDVHHRTPCRNLLNDTLKRTGLTRRCRAAACTSPRTTSVACSPPRPSAAACRSTSPPDSSDTQHHHHSALSGDLPRRPDPHLPRLPRPAPSRSAQPPNTANPPTMNGSEFQQHFELRKVELGTCARPYGDALPPRTRLHPLPHAARRSQPTPPPGRDHPQPRRPHRRSHASTAGSARSKDFKSASPRQRRNSSASTDGLPQMDQHSSDSPSSGASETAIHRQTSWSGKAESRTGTGPGRADRCRSGPRGCIRAS